MSKFILLIIILNLIVVIYNLYMWYKVGIENEALKKENEELLCYKRKFVKSNTVNIGNGRVYIENIRKVKE